MVVGGLIGTATPEKDGLMPMRWMYFPIYVSNTSYYYQIASIGKGVGFSIIANSIKSNNANGNSVILLTGTQEQVNATSIRRGSYLQKIYFAIEDERCNIYLKADTTSTVNAFLLGFSGNTNINLIAKSVSSLPVGATEIILN